MNLNISSPGLPESTHPVNVVTTHGGLYESFVDPFKNETLPAVSIVIGAVVLGAVIGKLLHRSTKSPEDTEVSS